MYRQRLLRIPVKSNRCAIWGGKDQRLRYMNKIAAIIYTHYNNKRKSSFASRRKSVSPALWSMWCDTLVLPIHSIYEKRSSNEQSGKLIKSNLFGVCVSYSKSKHEHAWKLWVENRRIIVVCVSISFGLFNHCSWWISENYWIARTVVGHRNPSAIYG